MKLSEAIKYIKSDFYRTNGKELPFIIILWKTFINQAQGQGWLTFFRLSQCDNCVVSFIGKVLKRHYSHKHCIDIGTQTRIGKGVFLGHGICIVIHYKTIIGNNVNISQFVNIGTNTDKAPIIGDNVYIGPHVSIVGDVKIGNNVTIGAGAVVVKDIPDNATVVGVPAKVINYDNPARYILNRFPKDK